MRDFIAKQKQDYGVVWLAGLVAATGSLIVNLGSAYRHLDSIAMENEVVPIVIASGFVVTNDALAKAIAQHKEETAQAVDRKMASLEGKIDQVLDNQARVEAQLLRAEITALVKSQCQGAIGLSNTIARLKRDYEKVAGEPYKIPLCQELP